jgi:signal transduction histidine kinase
MLETITGWVERLRNSALALPAAVIAAALMLTISEVAYYGAETRLSRLVEMGRARVTLLRLMQRLTDAESGQRGYMMVGGDDYLVPYQTARADAQAGLRELAAMYDHLDDEVAIQLRDKIAKLVSSKLSEMEEVLRLHEEGRTEAALDVVRSGIGRDLMQQLRVQTEALIAQQNGRIERGLVNVFDTLLLNRIGVAAMTAVSLLVLVMFIRQGAALDRQRAERQAAMQDERNRLEREVASRTAELTELASHLQTAREDERARLARDLHDELGALLTAAKLDVARIRPKLQQSAPDLMPRLLHLIDSLNSGIALKRRIIEDLRPSTLSSLGLSAALEILCNEFADRSGLAVVADLHRVSLPPSAELTVFRLVQEALTNIAKYAKATEVDVRVRATDGQVDVEVRDNGCGFDPAVVSRGTHGLLGMRFRVEAERGQLDIRTQPGQGTAICARLPEGAAPSPAGSPSVSPSASA